MKRLAQTGMSMLEIAKAMNLTSRGSVSSAVKRYGIELESARIARQRAEAKKKGLEYLPTRVVATAAPEPEPVAVNPEPDPNPEPEIEEEVEAATEQAKPEIGVSINELEEDMCRWPIGDRYCGAKKVRGAYCAAHARIGYTASRERKSSPYIPRRR